ncbi:MAG: pyruvate, phosphate dikinase [Corynebacteriales bacterium]|nr:pyruvate, phosphate dikinase [Mycobacteriales bacterium]
MEQPRYVFDFAEGGKEQAELLGGKGANLAEMTRLGLPVPPGFTITTQACREYLRTGTPPPELTAQVADHLTALEKKMGRELGDTANPLLVSVRSGAAASMPGMMETVLNVGLNDESVHGLAAQSGDARFAWDSYRRLVQMFGKTVLGLSGEPFDEALEAAKIRYGVTNDTELSPEAMSDLVDEFKKLSGDAFPQDPREQLKAAISAVFNSWNTERAKTYRRIERLDDNAGTAVSVVAMVFGNLGADSGTGVAFTRDPATGESGNYGDYLANAQGEDVVAGIRNTVPLTELEKLVPSAYHELRQVMSTLEQHYRDLCDIEFTVERGKLWMLQTRVGKRTAAAAFRIAAALVAEGMITQDEALCRVTGAQLAQLMFPHFDPEAVREARVLANGIAASPGAAVGQAVFDSATAVQWAKDGKAVILVRRETNPDDLDGMIAANGVLTSRGGKTSHAAVVARGMGKTCVCGADKLTVGPDQFAVGDIVVKQGDVISIDGGTGAVYAGDLPVADSDVVAYFEGKHVESQLVSAVDSLMRHADEVRRMRVRANADTEQDAARARRFGGQGIGLCRTEHMFLGERRAHLEQLILARTEQERLQALEPLRSLQRDDFVEILRAMDGLPVTIRLIDPPLHEFLPDRTELAVSLATREPSVREKALLEAVNRLHEQNPMLGLRGVRLGLVIPGLFELQAQAIAEATNELREQGHDPQPEIMVPLVGSVAELSAVRTDIASVVRSVLGADLPIGTMIELPRAALTADQIAVDADFFSFGTNDLTQTTWGFSRDDAEGAFFVEYLERGIFQVSPFESLDSAVGELVHLGTDRGRGTKPDLKVGVCGEHGGDPDSIHLFDQYGLDYVSCSPFRIPIARLEAARATLGHKKRGD